MENLPLKELLYKMADDQLILGHRNSEWTGFGPLLEEDIAFSSMPINFTILFLPSCPIKNMISV
jgi:1,2-phenylacetyl-CoA epoxidase catalytic subunit